MQIALILDIETLESVYSHQLWFFALPTVSKMPLITILVLMAIDPLIIHR